MRIYRISSNKFHVDDRISAVFNGRKYEGQLMEEIEGADEWYVSFNDYQRIYDANNAKDDRLLEWMEGPIPESKLTLVNAATRWEDIKGTELNLNDPETFYYRASSFDVRQAKRIIHENPREKIQYDVNKVSYYLESGAISINEEIVEKADMSIPLIIVSSKGPNGVSYFPIDGWHRIARAIKEGVPTLPAYVLTLEETRKIMPK